MNICIIIALADFNSRPSARGDVPQVVEADTFKFQFTPLREGRRVNRNMAFEVDISIHAPPRGATACSLQRLRQHKFQFTPLREGRHLQIRGVFACFVISIHAPPRGATSLRRKGERHKMYFNSRPSARGDKKLAKSPKKLLFQFTPLREGRPG